MNVHVHNRFTQVQYFSINICIRVMMERHHFLNLTLDYNYLFLSPGKSEGGSPGRDTTTLTMSPFGGVAGALNVPSALFSDSASRIPKSDPMEGRLQVPDLNFWSRWISFDLLQTNYKTSTNKNEQISGHAALQHGANSRPSSWHTRRLSESSRTPFRSQYRTEALRKVGSIFSVKEIFIEKDK